MKMKEESGKVGLKLIIQKTKIMASSPITSWQINGETMKQWETLFWGAQKSLQMVTAVMKLTDAYSLEEIEKAMAPHSSTLAGKITWTEEPGGRSPQGR